MQLPNEFDRQNPAPVLIAGATASGKSALALELAKDQPSIVVNADALQVYEGWRILTARPDDADLAQVAHLLDGHVAMDVSYSVGHWLRDVRDVLAQHPDKRPIIIGGTGLYFQALTQGLAEIPKISPEIKAKADEIEANEGRETFAALLKGQDPLAFASVDIQNPARTRRAWEVLHSTGRSITAWQAETPPPILRLPQTQPLLLDAEPEFLNDRIDQRFDMMIDLGALAEAEGALKTFWDPNAVSCQAIGAPELIAHLQGELSLEAAISLAKTKTRQFAKRQRTWFRSKMRDWMAIKLK